MKISVFYNHFERETPNPTENLKAAKMPLRKAML